MNTRTIEQFYTLNTDALATVEGGGGEWLAPMLPGYEQLLSSICGLAD
ncbi:ComC/BlpC family leader-containing pheromone/bacteriocin, partial [Streptococcus iniae]